MSSAKGGLVLLIAEGPHFTFHVIHTSKRAAMRSLLDAWRIHAGQTYARENIKDALTINCIENMHPGDVYRDYQRLLKGKR